MCRSFIYAQHRVHSQQCYLVVSRAVEQNLFVVLPSGELTADTAIFLSAPPSRAAVLIGWGLRLRLMSDKPLRYRRGICGT